MVGIFLLVRVDYLSNREELERFVLALSLQLLFPLPGHLLLDLPVLPLLSRLFLLKDNVLNCCVEGVFAEGGPGTTKFYCTFILGLSHSGEVGGCWTTQNSCSIRS